MQYFLIAQGIHLKLQVELDTFSEIKNIRVIMI